MGKHIKLFKLFESKENHEIYDIIKPSISKYNDLRFSVDYVTTLKDGAATSFIIKITSDSRLYFETNKEKESIVFYKDSDSDKYNLLEVNKLLIDITQELHKYKRKFEFKITDMKMQDNFIIISFERNLIHEICSMCEEILLELVDVGFSVVAKYALDNHKYYLAPVRLTMCISRENKFKYLKDEKEKPIFYVTGRGNYEEMNIDDYIEWLSDYLKGFGMKYKGDNFSYENKQINIVFEKKSEPNYDVEDADWG